MNPLDPPTPDPDFEHPELLDRLDEKVVTVPCYEPAGQCLELTGRALVTHSLLLGQTGSGKTSILKWFLKSLIRHSSEDSRYRPGIFVFDLNGGDTLGLVRKWAAECGRSEDVRLLTAESGHFDLFSSVRSLEDLSSASAQFMHGDWIGDSENAYWRETTRTLVDAALTICLTVTGRIETNTVIRFLTNWLISKNVSSDDEALLTGFTAMVSAAPLHLDKQLVSKLEVVRATVEMWAKLDGKTKAILNSCLLDAIGPLASMETRRYLDDRRGAAFAPEDIVEGKIMVFSVAAGKNLESALLLGRLMKSRLYLALQDRPQTRDQRLCCVFADEYHYLASGGVDRSSDVTALATLRSRCVAVIAATQSLNHLASVMSAREFRSLLPNFGNCVFFRSTEDSTGSFATAVMGTRHRERAAADDMGNLMVAPPPLGPLEFVCPPGALTTLEPCQAYVALSTGYRSPGMIWLAGNHESPAAVLHRHAQDLPVADPLAQLRVKVLPKLGSSVPPPKNPTLTAQWPYSKPQHFYDESTWDRLLKERRFRRSSFRSYRAFRQALAKWGPSAQALDSLPVCWWDAVANMTVRFAQQHGMQILGMHESKGCLEVVVTDLVDSAALYLDWIARIQLSVYPTRIRPLKRRDERLTQVWASEEEFALNDAKQQNRDQV